MIRRQLIEAQRSKAVAFRWRGGQVSRIEGFSDAVFGFALTLLVVSLEVPRTFDELVVAMQGFVGFAICFCLLSLVWYDHYIFFRRYGLHDTATLTLNLVLLFLVVLYVYPLKFQFTLLVHGGAMMVHGQPAIRGDQMPTLMIIYGAGFVAVYAVFALMYLNAHRQRLDLELTDLEAFDTRASMGSCLVLAGIGVSSIALASFRTPACTIAAGGMYWLIGFAMYFYWTAAGRRRTRLETALGPAAANRLPDVAVAAEPGLSAKTEAPAGRTRGRAGGRK